MERPSSFSPSVRLCVYKIYILLRCSYVKLYIPNAVRSLCYFPLQWDVCIHCKYMQPSHSQVVVAL